MPDLPNPPPPPRQRSSRRRLLKKAADNSHAGRSDVYRWLRREHASVSEAMAAYNPSWETLARTMIAEGVRGRFGSLPNAKSIPKVWARVCRDVEAGQVERAAKKAVRSKPQVAAPHLTYPTMSVQAASIGNMTAQNAATSEIGDTKPGVAGPVSREVARARIAEVRRSLNARSGR